MSIVSLGSVKSIRDWRLFLIDEVNLVRSLRSSHWWIRLNVSLFKCTCRLYRRIRRWNPKITIQSFFIEVNTWFTLLLRHIFWIWEIFLPWYNVVWWILLLKLLFRLIIILIARILVLHYYWSLWGLRRSISSWRSISSTLKELWRIAFSGLISDVWYFWLFFSV